MIAIFAELSEGIFKKSVLEAATVAKHIGNAAAICSQTPSEVEIQKLALYGIEKIYVINGLNTNDTISTADALAKVCNQLNIHNLIISASYLGKSIAPKIAAKLNASLCTNVISLPEINNGFKVKKSVFSGKGFAFVELKQDKKVLTLTPNSIDLKENPTSSSLENITIEIINSNIEIISTNKQSGKIPLTEAEIVVSGGRGLKGPENWGMIEELADILGAATACSKPVSDMHWRPHSEHVGQTGITIKPNLYIAVGISGAIQHLAGVSSSKVIVAINKDPEAPFFKAADIGIVGDAFEIMPKIISAAKNSSTAS